MVNAHLTHFLMGVDMEMLVTGAATRLLSESPRHLHHLLTSFSASLGHTLLKKALWIRSACL